MTSIAPTMWAFACTIGLALVLSSPAEAAKASKHRAPVAAKQAAKTKVYVNSGNQTQAVRWGSLELGADPDPFIRKELLRDLTAKLGGNY